MNPDWPRAGKLCATPTHASKSTLGLPASSPSTDTVNSNRRPPFPMNTGLVTWLSATDRVAVASL